MSRQPSYRHNNPKGWCGDPKRGTSLGRQSIMDAGTDYTGYAVLRPVRVNKDGYDYLGTYWGVGRSLWWCATRDYKIDFCLRADDEAEARTIVRKTYPNIKFYKER